MKNRFSYLPKKSREMRRAPSARPRGMRDAKYGRKILRPSCIPKGGACPPLLKSYRFSIFFIFVFSIFVVTTAPAFCEKQLRSVPPRILIILTNIDQVPVTNHKTGFWAEEYIVPVEIFKAAGFQIVTGSIGGGEAPIDQNSLSSGVVGDKPAKELKQKLLNNPEYLRTKPLRTLSMRSFAGLFVVGGHGVMWDLTKSPDMQKLIIQAVEYGRLVSAVCHGPGALLGVRLKGGAPFLQGKTVTGFSAREEELAQMDKVVPYCLEEELQHESAGNFWKTLEGPFKSHVIDNGLLITGQNPASSRDTAWAVVKRLKELLAASE